MSYRSNFVEIQAADLIDSINNKIVDSDLSLDVVVFLNEIGVSLSQHDLDKIQCNKFSVPVMIRLFVVDSIARQFSKYSYIRIKKDND